MEPAVMRSRILTPIVIVTACVFFGWRAAVDRPLPAFAREAEVVAGPGSQLPPPDPAFGGKVGATYKDSTPSFPLPVKAAKGSPNVLLILLDDVGFGMCSTFGGPVPTPHMERLAANGLK